MALVREGCREQAKSGAGQDMVWQRGRSVPGRVNVVPGRVNVAHKGQR